MTISPPEVHRPELDTPVPPPPVAKPRRTLLHVLLVALVLSLVVGLYTPATLYAGNERLFYFPLIQVLPVFAVATLVLTLALTVPALVMPARIRRFYVSFLLALVVFVWLRGFVLVADYGLLDGDVALPRLTWPALALSIGIVVVTSVVLSLRAIRPRSLVTIVIVVAMVLVGHVGVLLAQDRNPVRGLKAAGGGTAFALGPENLIIVLLDSLQSEIFADVVRTHPEFVKALDGFTYYPNTLSAGPTTFGSLPTIHSGAVKVPGTSMRHHFDDSITNRSFLSRIETDNAWDVTLLNPVNNQCPADLARCFPFDPNRSTGTRTHLLRQTAELADLSLFRLAPPELKGSVYNHERWLLRRSFDAMSNVEASDAAIQEFTANLRTGGTQRTVTFLHLFSTHPPATRTADCALLDEPTDMTRELAHDVTTCALTRVTALIERLKDLGAYASTSMIMLADHGYVRMPSVRVEDDAWRELIGRANPMFAVKKAGATGPIVTSDKQMWLADVGSIACSLTKACDTTLDWEAVADDRPRIHTSYRWGDRFWLADTLPDERRFEVRGPMHDPASWTQLKESVVPPVELLTFSPDDSAAHYGFGWGKYANDPKTDAADQSRWAVGTRASLFLRLPKSSACRLRFTVGALPEHKDQSLRVEVNGRPVAETPLRTPSQDVEVVVPRTAAALKSVDQVAMYFNDHRYSQSRGDLDALAVRFDELGITCGASGMSVLPDIRRSG